MNTMSGRMARKLRSVSVLCCAILMLWAPQAYAITSNDFNSAVLGMPFYDPNAEACLDGSGSTDPTGNDNVEKAYNYFIAKRLSPIAAAGIVGNLMEESGVDPRNVENPPSESDTIPPSIIGKYGYGIAQWTSAGRQNNLIAAAQAVGKKEGDLGVQLDYLWKEATTDYASVLSRVKAATTIEDSTRIWMGPGGYENPSVPHYDIRLKDAKDAYAKYGGGTAAPNGCVGSTNFVTNFVEYKQCNSPSEHISVPWATAHYGDATVCFSGCGPSAMAMIISNMTGQRVTPDMTAAYGAAHGTAAPVLDKYGDPVPGTLGENGSYGAILAPVLSEHWGLKSTNIGFSPSKINTINDALRNGSLILAAAHGPLPFSTVGHFIVIRAVTDDGKWLVGNSMVGIGNTLNTKYDPVQMTASATFSNAWIISSTGGTNGVN